MKILKSILNYIPLATFIIFVVTDGIFSLTSALIFVISTIGLLINWKRKKTEMKNWENFSLQNWPKIQPVRKSMILRTGFCVFTAFFFVYELFGVKKLVFGWGIERAGIEMREVDKCFDWRNNLYMIV